MAKTELDYVKVKRVSERITGQPRNIRHTTGKFKQLIEECNKAVDVIVSRFIN